MTTRFKRPLKAETVENLRMIRFPAIVSAKIDGIRCLVDDGSAWTSTLKPLPNHYVRQWLSCLPNGLDGELTPRAGDANFQACTSSFMSQRGEPDFMYWLFDFVPVVGDLAKRYDLRLLELMQWWSKVSDSRLAEHVCIVPMRFVTKQEELEDFMEKSWRRGFHEGVIVRDPAGVYKHGRSTLKEGLCLKIKYRLDSEAEVVGFVEQHHNTNAAEKDARGLTKRSSAKAGKVLAHTLGAFVVRDLKSGVEFEIGTGRGLDAELRKSVWQHQKLYRGKIIKYSYQAVGIKQKPRQPSFLGFRDRKDMSE